MPERRTLMHCLWKYANGGMRITTAVPMSPSRRKCQRNLIRSPILSPRGMTPKTARDLKSMPGLLFTQSGGNETCAPHSPIIRSTVIRIGFRRLLMGAIMMDMNMVWIPATPKSSAMFMM